jgi:hypothetical protein
MQTWLQKNLAGKILHHLQFDFFEFDSVHQTLYTTSNSMLLTCFYRHWHICLNTKATVDKENDVISGERTMDDNGFGGD